MKKAKQAIRDASLTLQDAWKLVARHKKLSPTRRDTVVAKLRLAREFIDEALALLEGNKGNDVTQDN